MTEQDLHQMAKAIYDAVHVNGQVDYGTLHDIFETNMELYTARTDDPIACNRGCSFCCTLRVHATRDEVEYIMEKYQRSSSPEDYQRVLKTAFKRHAKTSKMSEDAQEKYREACAFLDKATGDCSIYEDRPLSCRSMYVTNVQQCIDGFNGLDSITEFHGYPKILIAAMAIAIRAIEDQLLIEQAAAKEMDGNHNWITLEAGIVNFNNTQR